ncbi:hypothetical protein HIM_12524 [Hirsutella minnesotensis 3608]|uniref:Uncharacterized protein n=1 Tax=Hirsutella minnesotensis 3608 TaxID=1043627 RepID=A0A0F7ZHX4_9HYPO|nr:hypothetical protein HIM_12524 [Hirsutella minnesotensis 3608]
MEVIAGDTEEGTTTTTETDADIVRKSEHLSGDHLSEGRNPDDGRQCCCDHARCAALRDKRICRRLYEVLVLSGHRLPGAVLAERIENCLFHQLFEYMVVEERRNDEALYRVLIYLCPDESPLGEGKKLDLADMLCIPIGGHEDIDPEAEADVDSVESWSCCSYRMTRGLFDYQERVLDGEVVAGDRSLLQFLAEDAREAGVWAL